MKKYIVWILGASLTFIGVHYLFKYYKYNIKLPNNVYCSINYKKLKLGDLLFFSNNGRLETIIKTMTSSHFNHVGVYIGNNLYWHITLKGEPVISEIKSNDIIFVRQFKHDINEFHIILPLTLQQNSRINKKFVKIWYENKLKSTKIGKYLLPKKNVERITLTCAQFCCDFYKLLGYEIKEKVLPSEMIDSNNHLFYPLCKVDYE